MKTPEKYYEEFVQEMNETYRPNSDHQRKSILKILKKAQIDAYQEGIKYCTESLKKKMEEL